VEGGIIPSPLLPFPIVKKGRKKSGKNMLLSVGEKNPRK
jgi:hypothetical protein